MRWRVHTVSSSETPSVQRNQVIPQHWARSATPEIQKELRYARLRRELVFLSEVA
jgi:hypothetical protein